MKVLCLLVGLSAFALADKPELSSSYGAPSAEYGAPPAATYGAPPSAEYGAPAAPPAHYGPPPATYGAPAPVPAYGPHPAYAVHAIPAYIVPVHGHKTKGKGDYDGGYDEGYGLTVQKGKKTYFNDKVRSHFGKLRFAKDYLKSSFDNFKARFLEWKGRVLRAKGYFLADKGEKYFKKAKEYGDKGKSKAKGGKVKGYYYEEEPDYHYYPEDDKKSGKGSKSKFKGQYYLDRLKSREKAKGKGKGGYLEPEGKGYGGKGKGKGSKGGEEDYIEEEPEVYDAPKASKGYEEPEPPKGYKAPKASKGYEEPEPPKGYKAAKASKGYQAPKASSEYLPPAESYEEPASGYEKPAPSYGASSGPSSFFQVFQDDSPSGDFYQPEESGYDQPEESDYDQPEESFSGFSGYGEEPDGQYGPPKQQDVVDYSYDEEGSSGGSGDDFTSYSGSDPGPIEQVPPATSSYAPTSSEVFNSQFSSYAPPPTSQEVGSSYAGPVKRHAKIPRVVKFYSAQPTHYEDTLPSHLRPGVTLGDLVRRSSSATT